jgi:hypothetical protein
MIITLKSSRAINLVNVHLVPDVSEAVSASIIRDLYNECCVRTLYIYTYSCLLSQSGPLAWGTVGREGGGRERERVGGERHYNLRGSKNIFFSSFEGSQAMPARPSGRDTSERG